MPSLPRIEQFECYNQVKLFRERMVGLEKDLCPGRMGLWIRMPFPFITRYYLFTIL